MKLAIDSSVMIGILSGKPEFKPWSELLIDLACKGNQIVACGVVWAEVSSEYEDEADLRQDMKDRRIEFDALEPACCYMAGCMFRQYKKNCRRSRKKSRDAPPKRILADFLVGAHAIVQTGGLVTNDTGYFKSYFCGLPLHYIES